MLVAYLNPVLHPWFFGEWQHKKRLAGCAWTRLVADMVTSSTNETTQRTGPQKIGRSQGVSQFRYNFVALLASGSWFIVIDVIYDSCPKN